MAQEVILSVWIFGVGFLWLDLDYSLQIGQMIYSFITCLHFKLLEGLAPKVEISNISCTEIWCQMMLPSALHSQQQLGTCIRSWCCTAQVFSFTTSFQDVIVLGLTHLVIPFFQQHCLDAVMHRNGSDPEEVTVDINDIFSIYFL